ncbi:hypothetical protein HK104_003435 [Borealophlyctis nickersoniae]|nr:hypothetical protein HK104_003435 [Borealophlyctis nickersoniae]
MTRTAVVIEAKDLVARDRNGTSDPFVICKLGDQVLRTPVVSKNLNPTWNSTFDFTITPILSDASLSLTVWDKDLIGKDFLGQLTIPIADIPTIAGAAVFDDPNNMAVWLPLNTRSTKESITGDICVKLGFVGNIEDMNLLLNINVEDSSVHGGTMHATLMTSDDPCDDVYFNYVAGVEDGETSASSLDSVESSSPNGDANVLDHNELMGLLTLDNLGRLGDFKFLDIRSLNERMRVRKKTFRTKSIRHTRNPTWHERVFLHIKLVEYQADWPISFSVYDHDKISNNDRIGNVDVKLRDLIGQMVPLKVEASRPALPDLRPLELPLELKRKDMGEAILSIRFNFIPYKELRRNFWLTLIKTFDSDSNGSINKIELTTMLDSLGSTFSDESINMMFMSKDKTPDGELTFDELCDVLEAQLTGQIVCQDHSKSRKRRSTNSDRPGVALDSGEKEHVISLRECPICRKVIKQRGDLDVVSHVALCANEDLGKVDTLIMGNFLTKAHASRKWYTKVISYVTYGGYSIGKNNANILVQDRATGQLVEERIPTYIRLGMRLLYQMAGARTAVESRAIRALLKNLTVKQGRKFEDPVSKKAINHFIAFHKLPTDESKPTAHDPLESFKNFNEFFYRKLKPEARTLASQDPRVAVSPADCRCTCFPTIAAAKQLWVKGSHFTIASLLQDEKMAELYDGGSMAIFRLAPQDYHRFHIPVDGVMSATKWIEGAYFTVNPMAVRTTVDVYTDNVRCISYITSPIFGKVAYVCIGAMMVGSIILTTTEGQQVKRMDEHGYFAFGGSTIILLFEKNVLQFDKDLVDNTEQHLETLVKMGNSIGVAM